MSRPRLKHMMLAPFTLLALPLSGCATTPHPQMPDASTDACALAHKPAAAYLMQIPFRTVEGRIYVDARVNGQGPFVFAIDTGASGVGRADKSLTDALSLPVHGEAQTSDGVQMASVDLARIDTLELGSFYRRDINVITRDYSKRMSKGAPFSGIIGRDFFADGLLIIDYPNRTLSFTRTLNLPRNAKDTLPYERPFRIPVRIGDLAVEGNLDTGANVAFMLPQSLYDKIAADPLTEAGRGGLTNGDIAVSRSKLRENIYLGAVSLEAAEVKVSSEYPELLVGAHALQHFTVMIDQRSKAIALCKPR